MELNEYSILLNTGERFEIVEIRKDQITNIDLSLVLDKCPVIPREIVEEAKLGHSKRFQLLLNTNPIGSLMKFKKPNCRLINNCAMADKKICLTTNVNNKSGNFPECWEFTNDIDTEFLDESSELITKIVHLWKMNKYVIISD
jgi:hypothetical protein